jgi:hypothetical protein
MNASKQVWCQSRSVRSAFALAGTSKPLIDPCATNRSDSSPADERSASTSIREIALHGVLWWRIKLRCIEHLSWRE